MSALREAAHSHYLEHGDKVFPSTGVDDKIAYVVNRGDAFKYAMSRLHDEMSAEDAVQDAYVEMLAYTAEEKASDFGALYMVALNRCISRIRTADMNHGAVISSDFVVDEEEGLTAVDMGEDELTPDLMYEVQEKVNRVMALSDHMRPRSKHIIRRIFIFGYTPDEVATMMKVSTNAVYSVVKRFRKVLEKHYDN